jgi:hypothetical protein
MPTAEELLAMLRRGGCIVSSGDSSPEEIEQARVCGRLHVDARGCGYVYRPAVRTLPDEGVTADLLPFQPAPLPVAAAWDFDMGQYGE